MCKTDNVKILLFSVDSVFYIFLKLARSEEILKEWEMEQRKQQMLKKFRKWEKKWLKEVEWDRMN